MSSYPHERIGQSSSDSAMAIVSLVTGILGLTFFPIVGSIIAVITGYMARSEIRNSGGALGGENFATVGLVLGWIGVGLAVVGCCIGSMFFLLPVCLIPLGVSLEQFGALFLFVV